MDERLLDALEECLAALETGEAIEAVLARYPLLREELHPLLEVAQTAQSLSPPGVPGDAQQRSRTRLLGRAAELRSQVKPRWNPLKRLPKLAMAALLVLVILLSGSGLIVASARTLPGDAIYPVKRAVENIRLVFTFDPKTHHKIEIQFQERRLSEVEQLLEQNRTELIFFFGEINQQSPEGWVVGGLNVLITPETLIIGEMRNGDMVEVEGVTLSDGWVQASEIHLQSFQIRGFVESISPSVWIINGQQVQIEAQSLIAEGIQVGDYVSVTVHSDDFGMLVVLKVSPAISPSATPTVTPTPQPAPTMTPSNEAFEGEDAKETEEVEEPEERKGDDEPGEPNETDEAGETPDASETPEAEKTYKPSETKEPEKTDEPKETDKPDETERPKETDEPDHTDQPDETDEPEN